MPRTGDVRSLTLGDQTVRRMGYGAMQLTGPQVFGPPRDIDAAIAVLREAVRAGVNHIDTSDFYGPHVVNELIREALHPYPADLLIVTKVGAVRGPDASWNAAISADQLRRAVDDNLRHLALDQLPIVNYRVMGGGGGRWTGSNSIAGPFEALARLQEEGLIRHLGISGASSAQIAEAIDIAPVVCVQNQYNIAYRNDDELIDALAANGIAYVPFFPLGGFTPLQSARLNAVAATMHATPMQVALAWLLRRSPNILLIPGTSSLGHLRENLAATTLELSDEAFTALSQIGV